MEFGDEGQRIAVNSMPTEPNLASKPAIAERRADDVVTRSQERCYIVSLGLDALLIIAQARREILIADSLAVDR